MTFLSIGSKHCNIGGRRVQTARTSMLNTKPHLVAFHWSILVRLRIFSHPPYDGNLYKTIFMKFNFKKWMVWTKFREFYSLSLSLSPLFHSIFLSVSIWLYLLIFTLSVFPLSLSLSLSVSSLSLSISPFSLIFYRCLASSVYSHSLSLFHLLLFTPSLALSTFSLPLSLSLCLSLSAYQA